MHSSKFGFFHIFTHFLVNFPQFSLVMTTENGGESRFKRQIRWLSAGAAAGLAVDLSLYPIDTIKTRMQSKQGFKASGGFRKIYRGIPVIALGSAPGSALFFLTYSNSRELIRSNVSHTFPAHLIDAISASFGELMACLARVPTEIVKQRAQTSSPGTRLTHIVKDLFESRGGIRGFYKGYVSTVSREIPFSFIEFPLWEWLKVSLVGSRDCTPLQSAACGSLAGSTAAAITTPLDVLKTRIMLDKSRQTRLVPTVLSILRNEGFLRLYAGVLPRALWMGAGGFIFFFAYEFTLRSTHFLF